MKVTIEIPDALYRRVKSRAARDGRTVREVSIQLYERWLDEGADTGDGSPAEQAEAWLARWEELGRQVAAEAIDERSLVEIVLGERR